MAAIMHAVAINQGKGGVGKTSSATNVGGVAAAMGLRTLVLDLDPQGNCRRDFGYPQNDGVALFNALVNETALPILRDVRPGLDVVPGGEKMFEISTMDYNWYAKGEPTFAERLYDAIDAIADDYDLIIIDTPPNEQSISNAVFSLVGHVLIPTGRDNASLDGVGVVAQRFKKARRRNPDLNLLGVVIFGENVRSRRIKKAVEDKLTTILDDVAPIFKDTIPYQDSAAIDARDHGLLIHELDRAAAEMKTRRFKALREKDAEALKETQQMFARDVEKLKDAYQGITTELLVRMDLIEEEQA